MLANLSRQDFYSRLGVSMDATDDEIKKAFRKIASPLHPDGKSIELKDLYEKIFRLYSEAKSTLTNAKERQRYDDKLTYQAARSTGPSDFSARPESNRRRTAEPDFDEFFRQGFGAADFNFEDFLRNEARSHAGGNPRQHTRAESRPPREETTESVEAQIFGALNNPREFKKYVLKAKAKGISSERIAELVKTPKAQDILQKGFISFVEIHGKDGAEKCIAYAAEWKESDVDVSKFFNLQKVAKFLETHAIEYKIEIYGKENPDKFLEFVNSWKRAGVDLSNVVQLEKVKKFFEVQTVEYKIEIYGKENPDKFLAFAREWKKAGVDLSGLVNSTKAQAFLEDQSRFKLRHTPTKFKTYVQSWMQAGWKPSQEIMEALSK